MKYILTNSDKSAFYFEAFSSSYLGLHQFLCQKHFCGSTLSGSNFCEVFF